MLTLVNKFTDYLKSSKIELKKVIWPAKEETIRLTIIVIALSIAIALFLGILDLIFGNLLRLIL